MSLKHPALDPCQCGCDLVDGVADGITITYTCSDCGAFIGELIMGHEP